MKAKIALILIASFFISSCGKLEKSPSEVLLKYLEFSLKGNNEQAYDYISANDKQVKDKQKYIAEGKEADKIRIYFANKISYKIKNSVIQDNTAKITADVSMPDFSSILMDIMGAAFKKAFDEKKSNNNDEINNIIEKYKNKDLPIITTTQEYNLVKESDGWKVFLDWTSEKNKEVVSKLLEEATKYREDKKLKEAMQKYEEVLKIDSNSTEAQKGMADIKATELLFKEKQKYFAKLEIKNIEISKGMFGGLGVFGEIKNTGDKTLKMIEITIFCLDKSGKEIFETKYHPILPTAFTFDDSDKLLKPNYSKKFGVKMDDAPSDWDKKVKIFISDIEFE